MDLVHRFSCGMQRGIESKCDFSSTEIVVNGLGHANDLQALAEELERNLLRAIAADADNGVNSQLARVNDHLIRNIADNLAPVLNTPVVERIAPIGGAQNGAASRQYPAHILQRELVRFLRPDQTIKTVGNADDLPLVF